MQIRDMFAENINRPINGVIKVGQEDSDALEQELTEYVITNELKKHFITFFNYYVDALSRPTTDTGVWISGFFGCGKSHLLKMLSYLLENREVNGIRTVERFRQKFRDDPATFMLIDQATRVKTKTILFNIDVEGSVNKDNTAVLRVFAKMFYNSLGFYGDNPKVVTMEQFIDSQGKTQQFRECFERLSGKSWLEMRKAFAFNGRYIVQALMETLDMSEEDARAWFSDKSSVDYSIARLVGDIKEYVDSQGDNFRLLFMVDEVGQYVGTETSMLLNLQSLTEELGAKCGGKVWIVCTGQEAIDEIIKVRADAFSRIQGRFRTRLTLSSSSVDEVIQKRILKKQPRAQAQLESLYNKNVAVLRNLFSFSGSPMDIKGYSGQREFADNFPFVPYQFIIVQKVFVEIRKHGNSGKHLSDGERSMLSGFQEAAQQIQDRDEYAIVPFYRFYDTVHTFLDSSIRRVIERCQRAADEHNGIEPLDVDVLKLLYLIRYIDDIPSTLDNITVLMADDIRVDKLELRRRIEASLKRLLSQNYIASSLDQWNFLTDDEQDVAREIKNTTVDTAAIVDRIGRMVYGEIYTPKKFRYGKVDFPFEEKVDDATVGATTGDMCLRILTVATDEVSKTDLHLMSQSKSREAIVVLADTPYYTSLESAMKIDKYVRQKNVGQLPRSMQDIIRAQQDQQHWYETNAIRELNRAIVGGSFFVDGEKLTLRGDDPKAKIDQALEYLVAHVYSELQLITWNADSDADILAILRGAGNDALASGMQRNQGAAEAMHDYLELQDARNLPTSMADVQSRYGKAPYGWREIDIAAVAAKLIYDQRVSVKYGGVTIQPDNPKLPELLRKKSETGKTSIALRHVVSPQKMRQVRDFLREYFEVMDVPEDEDGVVRFIIEHFEKQRNHYQELAARYSDCDYPDHDLLTKAAALTQDVLSHKQDNEALISHLLARQQELEDSQEAMARVESFFSTQVDTFDRALRFVQELREDSEYISRNQDAREALNAIRLICLIPRGGAYNYARISELNPLMDKLSAAHDAMLEKKRAELMEVARQCLEEIHAHMDASAGDALRNIVIKADEYFDQRKRKIAETKLLALLDGMMPQMWSYKDEVLSRIRALTEPPRRRDDTDHPGRPAPMIKTLYRQSFFPARKLMSEADIDAYVEQARRNLKAFLSGCDGIELK